MRPTYYKAWVSALAAALAILTRDLVGTGTYTQEHFDLLYKGPWARVIGSSPVKGAA